MLALALPALAAGPERGILWRIERGGETVGHLFGTIHSDRPEVLDLPGPVERAFERSERYAFELDLRTLDRGEIVRIMTYADGGSLEGHLPAPLWARVRAAAPKRGLDPRTLDPLEPWAVAMLLSQPRTDPQRVLDHALQRRALASGRPVSGLETIAEQLSVFDRLHAERQLELLRTAVGLIEDGRAEPLFEDLVRAWLRRDLQRLVALAEAHPSLPDPAANERFMTRLLHDRNRRMLERMQGLLDQGGAFVAVGAMHLAGERGLVRLLQARGFVLEAVY
ncbi:MAG: TraB/GumN family protein [Halofilum sp. (in: g-proteobacteria)]|nr:TraB/GumN family protein [Halofilum sp. (in: g-proteobacteria)]